MYRDPEVQALLDELIGSGRPSSMSLPLPEGRKNFDELFISLAESDGSVETFDLDHPGPNGPIPIRVYKPGAEPSPLVIYFHGGGWVFGDLDSHDPLCRDIARKSGCVVAAVHYRRAPESPFPAAFEDALEVVRHLSRHPEHVGAASGRPMVAGDSSGGNLAAAVSLALGNEGAAPAAQFLIYPALDPGMNSPSYGENATDDFLSGSEMEWYWAQYLGESNSAPSPFAAPALADDLSKMPPTVIIVAGCDPLRDDGISFADRLDQAGVSVELLEYDEMVHGFLQYTRTVSTARKGVSDLGDAIRKALT